ncbi:unnamed protein product [Phaeothamnion confervicola]
MHSTLAFSTFFNAALILTVAGGGAAGLSLPARAAWLLAAVAGAQVPLGLLKLRRQDKTFEKFGVR